MNNRRYLVESGERLLFVGGSWDGHRLELTHALGVGDAYNICKRDKANYPQRIDDMDMTATVDTEAYTLWATSADPKRHLVMLLRGLTIEDLLDKLCKRYEQNEKSSMEEDSERIDYLEYLVICENTPIRIMHFGPYYGEKWRFDWQTLRLPPVTAPTFRQLIDLVRQSPL